MIEELPPEPPALQSILNGHSGALVMLTRDVCPLCEKARRTLNHVQTDYDFELIEVDVDEDPSLSSTYGPYVPVGFWEETPVFAGRVDPAHLREVLTR